MHVFLLILAAVTFLGSAVCTLIIAIDAFQYEWWAGLLTLLTPYLIYYALFEFEHDRKGLIVAGSLGGILLAALFFEVAMGVPVMRRNSFTGFG